MAITFVAHNADSIGNTRSPATTDPTGTQADDILLCVFATDTNHTASGTPPTGWNFILTQDQGTDSSTSVFWKRATGGAGSDTWTDIFTANEPGVWVTLAHRGCLASGNPQDVAAASDSQASGTAVDTPTIVTVTAGAMAVGIIGADPGASRTFAWDGGIDERADSDTTPSSFVGNVGYAAIGDKIVTPAGSITLGGDASSSDGWTRIILALRPAAAGTPASFPPLTQPHPAGPTRYRI